MVQGNATLIIDLGNSSTKCTVLFGRESATGRYKERTFYLSNQFAAVSEDYIVSSDYEEETSTMLTVAGEISGRAVKGTYLNGEVQQHEKPTGIVRPTANRKKYESDVSVLSLELAFLHASKAIMNMSRISDYSQLDIVWNVAVLLPPGDTAAGSKKMEDAVRSIKCVTSIFPYCSVDIKVDKVLVLPEGYCAYIAVVFDKGHIYRPKYEFLSKEVVILFDVGAGTTDCCLVIDGKLVQSSKHTVTKGMNNVAQLVKRDLQYKGIEITDSDMQKGLINGYIRDGAVRVSIVDMINTAKDVVAQQIIEDFIGYLEVTDLKVRSIGYMLVCGGGSLSSDVCSEIKPLSEGLVNNFKELAPNISLIAIPTRTVTKPNETGSGVQSEQVEEQISPRDLNLIGASILAELL